MKQKIKPTAFLLLLSTGLIILSACSLFTVSYQNSEKISVEHVEATGDIRYEIEITENPVDIIFSFTNVNQYTGSETPDVAAGSITVNGRAFSAPLPVNFQSPGDTSGTLLGFIEASTRDLVKRLAVSPMSRNTFPPHGEPVFDAVDDTQSFQVFLENSLVSQNASCKSVTGPVSTAMEDRTLNIWVADDCWWESGSTKKHYITQEMVTALEDAFLTSGADNDIFDWTTAILGAEWGDTAYSKLIPFNREITILLDDIDDDNSDNGGFVGYFWPGNNYTMADLPESNERIMFVVDAVMYASPSLDGSSTAASPGDWTDTAYWPKIVFSTLAHEFQHMIHFYQKTIKANAQEDTETWINEMCSQLVEDFLADKIGVEGPRGVLPGDGTAGSPGNTQGRLPWFNQYLFRSLIVDSPQPFDLPDYSVAYAFGAWLARNYGGVDFLNKVVTSPLSDKEAIEQAVRAYTGKDESFERLLQRWGGAIFLSDKTQAPPLYQYNRGEWFTSVKNGIEYHLGSINLFNYDPVPEFADSPFQLSNGLTSPGSNVYLLAKENALGKLSWDIFVPEDVRLTVIFKGL